VGEGCEAVRVLRVGQPHVPVLHTQLAVQLVEEAFQLVRLQPCRILQATEMGHPQQGLGDGYVWGQGGGVHASIGQQAFSPSRAQ